jgi:hypothetical protein
MSYCIYLKPNSEMRVNASFANIIVIYFWIPSLAGG